MSLSIWQIAIVLAIAVLVFGPKRFGAVGRALRTGAREFKNSIARRFDDDNRVEPVKLDDATTVAGPESDAEVVDGELVEHRT